MRRIVAAGFFDGVHLGHRQLLSAARDRARCEKAELVVFTFANHPVRILSPERPLPLLTTAAQRFALLRACGADIVDAIPFTPLFAKLPAEDFIAFLKARHPNMVALYCGPDWRFGQGAIGTPALMAARGIAVEAIPFARMNGEKISSSRIRAFLSAGDLIGAERLLGRPYAVSGKVVSGKGLGRQLHFPTLNIDCLEAPPLVPSGVYVVDTSLGPGLANWGLAPTCGNRAWTSNVLEVHLTGGEVEGQSSEDEGQRSPVTVTFLRYLRPERRFPNLEALRRQITQDIKEATSIITKGTSR